MMEEEYVPTGHHVYSGMGFGRQRVHNEVIAKEGKPFIITQSETAVRQKEPEPPEEAAAPPEALEEPAPIWDEAQDEDSTDEAIDDYEETEGSAPEDIASRIAGDRAQSQADILELARHQAELTPEDIASRIANDRTQGQTDIVELALRQAEADDTMESEES